MNQEPNQDISLFELTKKIISASIGAVAVLLTGDPEGFSKDKKS